jgi:hypothetical protein
MKHAQAPVRQHTVDDMEVVAPKIAAEQLVDIIQSALASDLKIATGQQLIKILSRIAMAKCRRGEDYLHRGILATAIQVRKPDCSGHPPVFS